MLMQLMGKWIIVAGLLITITGMIIYFFGNHLRFLGKLPGDVHLEGKNFSFYFPVVTCILASIALTLIAWLVRKFF